MMRNKRVLLLSFSLLFLTNCSNPIPSDLKAFLDPVSFNYAYDNIDSGSIISTYQEFDNKDNLLGEESIKLSFSKTIDDKDYYIHYLYNYRGNKIVDNRASYETIMTYDSINLNYSYKEVINGADPLVSSIPSSKAYEYFVSIFYTNESTFKYGGYYYGDYFSANSHNPNFTYKISDDNLVFKADDENYVEGAYSSQTLCIEKHGMLVLCDEKITIDKTKYYATQKIYSTYNEKTNF